MILVVAALLWLPFPSVAATAPQLGQYSWQGMNGGNCLGVESEAEAGHSWWTNMFAMFTEGHPIDLGLGTGSAWIRRAGHSQPNKLPDPHGGLDPNTSCACATFGGGCRGGDNYSCAIYMQSIEGGPGYWSSGSGLPTTTMKWRIGDSVGCYQAYTGSPMFQFGQFGGHSCAAGVSPGGVPVSANGRLPMGFVQLANRMVLNPDGVALSSYGLLGVGYLRMPFGKVNATDPRNFWTVVLDSGSFSGPLGFFMAEYWKMRDRGLAGATRDFPDFSDVKAINVSCGAVEIDVVPALNLSHIFRLPRAEMPVVNGRTVMFMGQRGYTNDEVSVPLEKALASGKLNLAIVLARGAAPDCHVGVRNATYFGGPDGGTHWPAQSFGAQFGQHIRTEEGGDCVWSIEHANTSCVGNMSCMIPRFIDASATPIMKSLAEQDVRVPAALKEDPAFPPTLPVGPYDVLTKAPLGGCRDTPGPASPKLHCVRTTNPSWVAYRWYRFVDQPGLQQLRLSETEKAFMQARVAMLHRISPPPGAASTESSWIKPRGAAKEERLAAIDAAAIVTPPVGMEFGFVPIALYEGLEKPEGCDDVTTPLKTDDDQQSSRELGAPLQPCFDPVDATDCIQHALNQAAIAHVHLANLGKPWIVRPLFIRRSDLLVTFAPGAVVLAKAGEFKGNDDSLISITGASGVSLVGQRSPASTAWDPAYPQRSTQMPTLRMRKKDCESPSASQPCARTC
jgi:hypothetical protein